MNVVQVVSEFGLALPQNVIELHRGTVTPAWILNINGAQYVLRQLTSLRQAAYEAIIMERLNSIGFHNAPSILHTLNGDTAAVCDGRIYQLQTHCAGSMPDATQLGIPKLVAELAVTLRKALDICPAIEGAEDRFALPDAWLQARPKWSSFDMPVSVNGVEAAVGSCIGLPANMEQVIHGDFGIWNMLYDGKRLYVIDFGEARMGDGYFDVATSIGSLINHNQKEKWECVLTEFLDEYERHLSCNTSKLKEQLRLWYWRGIMEVAITPRIYDDKRAKLMHRFYDAMLFLVSHI